jgi:hypothetical protein
MINLNMINLNSSNIINVVHQGACEQWTHGEPVEVWRDENRILCIRYADGNWWHYSFKPTGLEWW